MKYVFFLSFFLSRIESESNSMGEVQNFDQFVTFNEEANKSTSNCGIVIYLILFLPSYNAWYLFKKAKLYESPKIEMVIKCFQTKCFICRLVEWYQLVKNLNPVHSGTFKFYFWKEDRIKRKKYTLLYSILFKYTFYGPQKLINSKVE